MPNTHIEIRKAHFAENWLAWSALRHFLPAPLVRELASVVVDEISEGTLNLSKLFDEAISSGPEWIDSWLLKPRPVETSLEEYLQFHIRGIAWRNDVETSVPSDVNPISAAIKPQTLEKALRLGTVDLLFPEAVFNTLRIEEQRGISTLFEIISYLRIDLEDSSGKELVDRISAKLDSVSGPLSTVIFKHCGDLCADADAWDKALALYKAAQQDTLHQLDSAWRDFQRSLGEIIAQSCAAAVWTIEGAAQADSMFSSQLSAATISESPLLLANATHDALVASYRSHDSFVMKRDLRGALVLPPLLRASLDPASALEAWLDGNYEDSQRRFWAVLRREIALGSVAERNQIKDLYSRSVIDDLSANVATTYRPEAFQMAIRLIVESGSDKSVAKIRWTDQLIERYVDERCVGTVVAHANRYPGSYIDRQRVAVELFGQWVEQAPSDRFDIAKAMLQHIALIASTGPTSLMTSENLGGRSLEILKNVAEKRPELRVGVASEVATAVIEKLSNATYWSARELAIEVAEAYGEVFSLENFQFVVDAVIGNLDKANPAHDAWPFVRPALQFLVSSPVKRFARSRPELGQRIVDTILRFGIQQKTEYARGLFYLHDFDPSLLRDGSVAEKMHEVLVQVRQRALQSNSSAAVENIQALLLAPLISGREGVRDALQGLVNILNPAEIRRTSISLPTAYNPLLLLASQQQKIADDLTLSGEEFRSWLAPVFELIIQLWKRAKDHPLIFASFSLPPATLPNPVIVRNWAYASIHFADSLQKKEELAAAFNIAKSEPMLEDPIARAQAICSGAESSEISLEQIHEESRDTFYSVIGLRLVAIRDADVKKAQAICRAMLDQCFRLGPRDLDAAVFLMALQLGLELPASGGDSSDYVKRLQASGSLRLTLGPLLNALGIDPRSGE